MFRKKHQSVPASHWPDRNNGAESNDASAQTGAGAAVAESEHTALIISNSSASPSGTRATSLDPSLQASHGQQQQLQQLQQLQQQQQQQMSNSSSAANLPVRQTLPDVPLPKSFSKERPPSLNPYATTPMPTTKYTSFGDVMASTQQTKRSVKAKPSDFDQALARDGLQMSATKLKAHPGCVKFGTLSKRGGGKKSKAYRRRYFVLVGGNLFYFKGEREKKPQGVIADLSSHVIGEGDAADQFSFSLVPSASGVGARSYVLCAKSAEEKRDWIRVIPAAKDAQIARIEQKLKSQFAINADDIEWEAGAALGKGASGVVKKGTWLHTQAVAVKLLNNIPEFVDPDEFREFFQEIETLSQLRHPCIVSMFGYAKKDGYLALVTEYVAGGDLAHVIHADTSTSIPFSAYLKVSLLQNICRGMVYLHSKNVVHRDLKPGNILVESLLQARVKVCDFGLSIVPADADAAQEASVAESTQVFGSPAYAAPELSRPEHTNAVDIFSFGIVLWELWLRTKPWLEYQRSTSIGDAIAAGKRPNSELVMVKTRSAQQKDPASTEKLRTLMIKCWSPAPMSRPTFQYIFLALESLLEDVPDEQGELMREKNTSVGQSADGRPNASEVPLAEILRQTLFRGEAIMPFETWAAGALPYLFPMAQPPVSCLSGIRAMTADVNGVVQSDSIRTLFSWFQPFCTDGDNSTPDAWRVSSVLAVFDHVAFVGFAAPAEAKEWLLQRPIGSFLFRFSSQVGMYALSATWATGSVGHWRIATEVVAGIPVFTMNGANYESLTDIVEQHAPGQTPIMAKDGKGGSVALFLTRPVTKQEVRASKEDIYD